jgi:tetratricopeptide (TPR) repeat protein
VSPEESGLLEAWAQASARAEAVEFLGRRFGPPGAEVVEHLKALVDRLGHREPAQAVRRARELVQYADTGPDPTCRVVARLALANALLWSERLDEAHHAYEAARRLAEGCGDALLVARCGVGWMGVLFRKGQYREALELAERIGPVLAAHPAGRLYAARVQAQKGTLLQYLGNSLLALQAYEAAAAEFRALGKPAALDLAMVQHNAGSLLAQLGRYGEAGRLLDAARACAEAAGSPLLAARAAAAVSRADLAQGRYAHALRVFEDVARRYEDAGVFAAAAAYRLFALECRLYLGQADQVAEEGLRVAHALERAGLVAEAARARYLAALGHRQQGNPSAAAELLREALEVLRRVGRRAWGAAAACELAALHLREGELSAASQLAHEAAAAWAQVGSPDGHGRALLVRSDALARSGDLAAAVEAAREALRLGQRHRLAWLCAAAHRRLSVLRPDRAAAHLRSGVRWADRMLAWLPADLRPHVFAELADLYGRAVLSLCHQKRWDAAWRVVQAAKSRSLSWLLASHNLRVPVRGAEASQLARQINLLLDAYRARVFAELRDPESAAGAPQELVDLEGRIRELLWRWQLQHPALASHTDLLRAHPPKLPELEADTALVEYFTAADHVWALVVEPDHTVSGRRLCPVCQVARLGALWANGLRAHMAGGLPAAHALRQATHVLRGLYEHLVLPLEGLLRRFSRLVVAPSGVLYGLPFHAFTDGQACVWDRWEVCYVPAGSLLPLLRRPTGDGPAVCVADPLHGRVPGALQEARWVARRLGARLRESPDPQAFLDALRGAKVVHVAAHCRFRPEAPLLSAIHLSAGPVTTADLLAAEADCQLVVLSGCETASARVLPGDELVGFARAWFHAGARALVVSLWPVEDVATAELMRLFYDTLCAGARLQEALRRAALELRAARPHPWWWAGFIAVGDGTFQLVQNGHAARSLDEDVRGGG